MKQRNRRQKFFNKRTKSHAPSTNDEVGARNIASAVVNNTDTAVAATITTAEGVATANTNGTNDSSTPVSDEPYEVNCTPLKPHGICSIIANLDYNDEEEYGKNESDEVPLEGRGGVQQKYVEAVQKRIQVEVNSNFTGNKWLLKILNENDWWIKREKVSTIISELKLNKEHAAYYRDVYVWLPDIRWPTVEKKMMPSCPNCKCNNRVGPHAFRDNHFGRVVVSLTETYYIISRRYICHECKQMIEQAKSDVESHASAKNLSVQIESSSRQYTFMAWDRRILPLYKDGRGELFPAILTWKAGIDKEVMDFMRSLYDAGVRPERFSDMLREWHSKKFTKLCIRHEFDHLACPSTSKKHSLLGDFRDKLKYRGLVPTGGYLARCYELFHEDTRPYLDMEVKKRGAKFLHWDASYKEAKHLYRYRGKPLFQGLITAMNEVGEVRIQFHIYTDSHEQMKAALREFKGTTATLGLPQTQLFFTDNPSGDKDFFLDELPSLRAQQEVFDAMFKNKVQSVGTAKSNGLQPYPYSRVDLVRIASTKKDIENVVRALLEDVRGKRIGLDALRQQPQPQPQPQQTPAQQVIQHSNQTKERALPSQIIPMQNPVQQQYPFQLFWQNSITPGPMFPTPHAQAMCGSNSFTIGGWTIGGSGHQIGSQQMESTAKLPKKGRKLGSTDKTKRRSRSCKRCNQYGGQNKAVCNGKGGWGMKSCEYFDANGQNIRCGRCDKRGGVHVEKCTGGKNGKTCIYFDEDDDNTK